MSKSKFSPASIGPGEKKDFDFDFKMNSKKIRQQETFWVLCEKF